jgi:putative ABC transport system permease protein
LPTYERNFVEQLDSLVLAKAAPGRGAAAEAAAERVAEQFPNVELEDQAGFRESQAAQLDQIVGLVTSLLALAIWIAVIGIVNTLSLSIYERTREIGLLRAVGMSRRQVAAMIRWESLIIAVFGALLGTVVGGFFGWAMVRALRNEGVTELAIPTGQLLIYIVVAGVIGIVAGFRPGRRAAKLDILAAIAHE